MAEKNTNTGLTTEDIITLMREMSNTGLKSMEFTLGDSTIKLEGSTNEQVVVAAPSEVGIANQAASLETKTTEIPTTNKQVGNEIKSPLVGVFYEAPQAGAKPFVKVGDKVKAGTSIALVGNTGEETTGTHLHFELWHQGEAVDPTKYIKF